MKKCFALFIAPVLLCACAFAEGNLFTGSILVGTLPKDAQLVRNDESADGYIEELEYDGLATIALACFSTSHAMDAYLDEFDPIDETVCDDMPMVCGVESTHRTFTTGSDEDSCVVNAYSFGAEEHVYLFLVSVDADAYADADPGYPELIETWLSSLQLSSAQ